MPHPPPWRVLVNASWLKRKANLGKSEEEEKDYNSRKLCWGWSISISKRKVGLPCIGFPWWQAPEGYLSATTFCCIPGQAGGLRRRDWTRGLEQKMGRKWGSLEQTQGGQAWRGDSRRKEKGGWAPPAGWALSASSSSHRKWFLSGMKNGCVFPALATRGTVGMRLKEENSPILDSRLGWALQILYQYF